VRIESKEIYHLPFTISHLSLQKNTALGLNETRIFDGGEAAASGNFALSLIEMTNEKW
jgi:hypothetical protein